MKILTTISLALLLLVAVGCSSDKPTASGSDEVLNFDVAGNDAPANMDAAIQELSALSITVPDPVPADDPVLNQDANLEAALAVVNGAALHEQTRVHFRRIIAHLHDQMQALRSCMASVLLANTVRFRSDNCHQDPMLVI